MNKRILALIKDDKGIASLESLPSPVIVTHGRALKYQNPACISEGYFNKDGRSCYTPYRIEIGSMRVAPGEIGHFLLPTVYYKQYAIAYGRENDTVFFFTKQGDGINDSLAFAPDAAQSAIKFTLSYVLSGGRSIHDYCEQLRNRIGMFNDAISYQHSAMLIDQLIYRLERKWSYVKPEKYDHLMLDCKELFRALAEMTDSLKTCDVSVVETEICSDGVKLLCDGICCGTVPVISGDAKARIMFLSTKSGLVASTAIALAADLIYGGAKSLLLI